MPFDGQFTIMRFSKQHRLHMLGCIAFSDRRYPIQSLIDSGTFYNKITDQALFQKLS